MYMKLRIYFRYKGIISSLASLHSWKFKFKFMSPALNTVVCLYVYLVVSLRSSHTLLSKLPLAIFSFFKTLVNKHAFYYHIPFQPGIHACPVLCYTAPSHEFSLTVWWLKLLPKFRQRQTSFRLPFTHECFFPENMNIITPIHTKIVYFLYRFTFFYYYIGLYLFFNLLYWFFFFFFYHNCILIVQWFSKDSTSYL